MTMIDILLLRNFNKLTAESFAVRLAKRNLEGKTDIANFVKKDRF